MIAFEAASRRLNRQMIYRGWMNLGRAALLENNHARLIEALRETFPKPGEDDVRGWEWHYLYRQLFTESRVAPVLPGKEWDRQRFLPTADDRIGTIQRFASTDRLVVSEGKTVRVIDPDALKELSAREATGSMAAALSERGTSTYSDNGRRVMLRRGDKIIVWDVGTGTEVFRTTIDGRPDDTVAALSADGGRIAWWPVEGKIAVVDVGTAVRRNLPVTDKPVALRFSPDSRWLLGERPDGFSLWHATTGGPPAMERKHPAARLRPLPLPRIVFNAKGTRLAVGAAGVIELFDLSNKPTWSATTSGGGAFVFTPDGDALVAVPIAQPGIPNDAILVHQATSGPQFIPTGLGATPGWMQFNAKGTKLLVEPTTTGAQLGDVPPPANRFAVIGLYWDDENPGPPAFTPPRVVRIPQPLSGLWFRPDGKRVFGLEPSGVMHEWALPGHDPGTAFRWADPPGDHELLALTGHVAVNPLAPKGLNPPTPPPGRMMTLQSITRTGTLQLRDGRSGVRHPLADFRPDTGSWLYRAAGWSADGKQVGVLMGRSLPELAELPTVPPAAVGFALQPGPLRGTARRTRHPTIITTRKPSVSDGVSGACGRRAALRQSLGTTE